MVNGIIPHEIKDWSKIDEREAFWGKLDLLHPEVNFGIHRYNNALWTSGLVGVGRVFDRDGNAIQENGREHILIVSSNYDLNPWAMLQDVMLDDEYEQYMSELESDKKFLFKIFFDQPLIRLPQGINLDAEILFALSYVNSCYYLCKKGLKKSLIYKEENYTAKLRGKIDVAKNIKHNTVRGRCDKFYCKYVDFTEDTIENRILKAALLKCKPLIKSRFPESTVIQNKISFCANAFKHVKVVDVINSDYNQVAVSGLYSYYKPVIQQARAMLDKAFHNYAESPTADTRRNTYTIPFVINMETLFEYYARTKLKELVKSESYTLEKYSKRFYLQSGVSSNDETEKGIHLMPYCIPDIVVCDANGTPVIVIDAKYKPDNRPDRSDSHQLLAYVLLAGVSKCGFVLPGKQSGLKQMKSTGLEYLSLTSSAIQYYELILGNDIVSESIKEILV